MSKSLCILSILLFLYPIVHSADLIEVTPVTGRILMLKFDDGYIEKHGYHESSDLDKAFLFEFDAERAENPMLYTIESFDDANYSSPVNPLQVGRKSKGHDFSRLCKDWTREPWAGAACKNDYASYHYIYMELDAPLVEGKTYTLKFGNIADNAASYSFTFDTKRMRANSIHTNNFGYVPEAQKKYAYISQWMGTMGPLTDDDLIGKRFDIFLLAGDGTPGPSVFNGTVAKQKNYDEADNYRSNETPYSNYVVSNVYECDFSSFTEEGEYILVVEGIGASYPFRIYSDAYHEAFYWTMKGVYLERALIDAPEKYAGKWAHPAWEDANFVYTHVRTLDLTDESGKNQRNNIFDNFDWTVDLSGIRGWYHDAGDWDGYFSHFRVPRTLMMSYELAPDNFKDRELDIPEAQVEYNGFSDTHIPDILDEAVWLVDYFKNNIGPTGGIYGSRIHPDISEEKTDLGITKENYPDFVFNDCKTEGIPSWEDCTTWIVHGEDPRDSYAFASIAAQYVYNLGLAEERTAEDYTDIKAGYLSAAETAYTWAANNTLAGDENKKHFVENRAAAAAWLYKVTGTESYLNQLKDDLNAKNITASTSDPGESKWAVWAYVTIDGNDPLYSGSFDAALQQDLFEVVKKYANRRVTNAIDANRSFRWGGDMMEPVWNGQVTTPWVLPAMVAHVACEQQGDASAQKYLDACYTTADYFLGGNQLNMVWMTYIGHEHTQQIMHLDSEYNPDKPGFIPGVPVYGPRVRCDWFAPGNPHPHAGDKCYYNNSHDADFALLDGRLYPPYSDDLDQLNWPVHELYFENYGSPPTNEYTVHQTIAPAAGAYGFLTASNGDSPENLEPTILLSSLSTNLNQGEDIEFSIDAGDTDGWVYRVFLYENNRLVHCFMGDTDEYSLRLGKHGTRKFHAVVEDNLGLFGYSDTLEIEVEKADDLPSVAITNILTDGLYRANDEFLIETRATGSNIHVEFFHYNEKIGDELSEPYSINWIPRSTGKAEITAKVTDDRGFMDTDVKQINITSDCLSMLSPEENDEFEPGSNVVLKAIPESCPGEILNVTFYLTRTQNQVDETASAEDGSYEAVFEDVPEDDYTVYAIAETEAGQVISDSIHFRVADLSIGINNSEIDQFLVFPNPSDGQIQFKYRISNSRSMALSIYTMSGKLVKQFEVGESGLQSEGTVHWDATAQAPGIYSYTLRTDESIRNGRIIIQK